MFNILSNNEENQNFLTEKKVKSQKELLAEYGNALNNGKPVSPAGSADKTAALKGAEVNSKVVNTNDNLSQWKAPTILKTNLIQDEASSFFNPQKVVQLFAISALSGCLVIAALYGGLFFWEAQATTRAAALDTEISSVNAEMGMLNKELAAAADLEKKINFAGTLLEKHVYWTNLFKFLEDNTLPNVAYTGGFSGSTDGEYNFAASTDSFASVSAQAKVLKGNKTVRKLEIVSAGNIQDNTKGEVTSGNGNVNFTVSIAVDPDIFFKKAVGKK